MSFKSQYQKSLKEVKQKELKNDKIKQAILTAGDKTSDLESRKKARNKIKSWMLYHNFLYIMKEILWAIVIAFMGFQPYLAAGDYIHTATTIPWKHITNGQVMELQVHAEGRYMLAAVIFGVALFWIINLPWKDAPYHQISVENFIQEQYPKIKKEAEKLNK